MEAIPVVERKCVLRPPSQDVDLFTVFDTIDTTVNAPTVI